ncbi:MAG: hypothetical protein KDA30_05430 [Phycisphaerales bacterium]|nr:hypothetical protein [Phycisphaerales bacterium]
MDSQHAREGRCEQRQQCDEEVPDAAQQHDSIGPLCFFEDLVAHCINLRGASTSGFGSVYHEPIPPMGVVKGAAMPRCRSLNPLRMGLVSVALAVTVARCAQDRAGDPAPEAHEQDPHTQQQQDSTAWKTIEAPASGPETTTNATHASASSALASDTQAETPKIVGGDDGFPTGQSTPEGVACDLARAFIDPNAELFRTVCLPTRRGSKSGDAYNDFLDGMSAQMEQVKGKTPQELGGPTHIETVYKARHLSMDGPASAGYALMQLSDVMFVDVVTPLWNGQEYTNRTLVVQRESDGKWYAMPRPDIYSMISAGLNSESSSTELWTAPASDAPVTP